MDIIKLLFKRDINESFSSFKGKKDVVGIFSSLFLLTVIYGVFIFVFSHFAKIYVGTDFGVELARLDRVREFFILAFLVVFLINVIVGVRRFCTVLTDIKDNDILIYQPINSGSVFIYKLIKVYLSQVISTMLSVIPLLIVMDMNSPLIGGASYYLLGVVVLLLLPFISCAIGALISIPFISVSKKISSKFVAKLGLYVIMVAVIFVFYGSFLNVLSELVRSGNLKYVFDLETINKIHKFAEYMYPSTFFANILLAKNTLINILAVLAISVVAVVFSFFVIKKVYISFVQSQLEGDFEVYHNKAKLKERNPMLSLIYKEFLVVLRTPTYAFQYFAMAISLPFMVYICSTLLGSMLQTLTIVDCNYAIAIFVVSMLAILSNTFCTSNISRDGKMFAILKTMPITIKQIINAKLIFCSSVSVLSVFASCLVLLISGFLNFGYFVIAFVIGTLFSFVQIAYATRKDMKNPCFPNNDKEEVLEGNSNMSTLIFTGLITSIICGGGSVLLSVILGMKYNETIASIVSIGFVLVITIVALLLSVHYLYKGVYEEYYASDI